MDETSEKNLKRYYSISEVSQMFDQPATKLRYWEKNFPELKPKTNNRGVRLYTQQDIELLKLIVHLVEEQGMTLQGAAKRIKENPNSTVNTTELASHLAKIRSQLVEIQNGLEAIAPNGQPF